MVVTFLDIFSDDFGTVRFLTSMYLRFVFCKIVSVTKEALTALESVDRDPRFRGEGFEELISDVSIFT